MRALKLPGYKVLLWERNHDQRLRNPAAFDALSVATWSTHDTQPIGAWWDDLAPKERDELLARTGLGRSATHEQLDAALFELLLRAGSDLALVLITELLGEKKRINTPGTVGLHNWTYRMPMPLDSLRDSGAVVARSALFSRLLRSSGRA